MRIFNEDGSEPIVRSAGSDVMSMTVENMECCSDFSFSVTASTIDFGTESPRYTFRTLPPDPTGMK